MTYEMEYLMHLFSCGATGRQAQPPTQPLDWEKVVKLAVEQSVTYTVALPIKKYDLGCPPHIVERLTSSLRGAAVKNALKTDAVLDILQKMEHAGIPTLLFKGIDVARYYKNPECRVSADTDIYVRPEDEERAARFLEGEGFEMKKRPSDSNHAVGSHPTIGRVELHIKFISDEFSGILLKDWSVDENAFTNCVKQQLSGREYYALEPCDNLIYLTFHMLKHFLYGGISLRMMMDNALYSKNNLGAIDCKRYEDMLTSAGFLYLMQVIFGAMVKYCGFDETDFPITPVLNDEDITALLNDLEAGGWQGQKAGVDGVFAWYCYRYQEADKSGDKRELGNIRQGHLNEYTDIVFPPMETMSKLYPKLSEKRYLYPYYLSRRLFEKSGKLLSGKASVPKLMIKDESELSDTAKERLELFKNLKIM